jgi:hypothetical protein
MDAHGHKHGTRPLTHFRVGVWGGQQNTDPKFGRVAGESVPPPAVVGAWCGDTRRAADRGSGHLAEIVQSICSYLGNFMPDDTLVDVLTIATVYKMYGSN